MAAPTFQRSLKGLKDRWVGKGRSRVSVEAIQAEAASRGGEIRGPALPYDEMRDGKGGVRPHYAALAERIDTLSADELAERQKTLERFFLLQGITFTVYGAESTTSGSSPPTCCRGSS